MMFRRAWCMLADLWDDPDVRTLLLLVASAIMVVVAVIEA